MQHIRPPRVNIQRPYANKTLHVFGDSWPCGAEMNLDAGEKAFGTLLSEHFNTNYLEYSEHSTSISHIVLQVQQCLQGRNRFIDPRLPEYAIVFLTSPLRDLIYSPGGEPIELVPTHPEQESVLYYKYFYTPKLSEYRTNVALLAIQTMFASAGITPIFLWGWDKINLWNEVDTSLFYPTSAAEMFTDNFTTIPDLTYNKNPYIWPNSGHPNQAGHRLIAQNLANFLQENIDAFR